MRVQELIEKLDEFGGHLDVVLKDEEENEFSILEIEVDANGDLEITIG